MRAWVLVWTPVSARSLTWSGQGMPQSMVGLHVAIESVVRLPPHVRQACPRADYLGVENVSATAQMDAWVTGAVGTSDVQPMPVCSYRKRDA